MTLKTFCIYNEVYNYNYHCFYRSLLPVNLNNKFQRWPASLLLLLYCIVLTLYCIQAFILLLLFVRLLIWMKFEIYYLGFPAVAADKWVYWNKHAVVLLCFPTKQYLFINCSSAFTLQASLLEITEEKSTHGLLSNADGREIDRLPVRDLLSLVQIDRKWRSILPWTQTSFWYRPGPITPVNYSRRSHCYATRYTSTLNYVFVTTIDVTIVPHPIHVSRIVEWGAWIGSCVLLPSP